MRVGIVTEPHGICGEVKVYPTNDDVTWFELYRELLVVPNGKEPGETDQAKLHGILSVKYQADRVILKLSGIETRNDAELLRKCELYVHRSRTAPLKEGQYLTADLYGMTVCLEDGTKIGTVEDVLKTGANDVFQIRKTDGKELLLPNIPACVKKADPENGVMTVFILPGLEDL